MSLYEMYLKDVKMEKMLASATNQEPVIQSYDEWLNELQSSILEEV